ncbi:hypothetical protein LTR66_002279 [Elasticomyces elasticus]|nr:hypothetical protein LTR66_002279 [Elasticomyces elasticus]
MSRLDFFRVVGYITFATLCYHFLRFVRLYTRPSSLPHYLRGPSPSWALVTGATDGIGKAFAHELCSRGFNVICHGRNQFKLLSTKKDLEAQFPHREIAIVSVDASNASAEDYERMFSTIGDKPLRILINNVGGVFHQPWLKTLESNSQADADQTIDVNLRFSTQLTRTILPILTKNSPALVINVSSLSSVFNIPYGVVYSGAKAYVNAFSNALRAEMRAEGRDVSVLTIQVGMVSSGTNKAPVNFMVPPAQKLAKGALDRVGCGRPLAFGYWPHHASSYVMGLLPVSLCDVLLQKRTDSIRMHTAKQD